MGQTKLQTFIWEGTNKKGNNISGEIDSTNTAMVRAELRRQGITPKKIKKKAVPLFGSNKGKKVKAGDISTIIRQISTMLNAGIAIVQSLDMLAQSQSNPEAKKLINNIKQEVEAGQPFSKALRKHPDHFNELYCNLIDAGEQSGSLDVMLERVATYAEKTETLKKKIKKALMYPCAVLIIALFISAGLLIFVVPQFEAVFNNFGADLPPLTLMVVKLSEFFQAYWYLIFGSIAIGIYATFKAKKKSPNFAEKLDKMSLKLPIIGGILEKAAIARFARTLSTTFAAGLPLIDALQSVSGATGNILYRNATLHIREEVSTGQKIEKAMRDTHMFPIMVIQMVSIGEEAGSLEFMLAKVAEFYEEDVDNAVDSLSSLLEPIIMVILGVLIGGLVIAMYLPIFQLGDVVR